MSLLTSPEITAVRNSVAQAGVFGDTCKIQKFSETQTDSGAPLKTWSDLTGCTSIPCYLSQMKVIKGPIVSQSVMITNQMQIRLDSYYSSIQIGMKAIVNTIEYEIVDLLTDSQKIFTVLGVQKFQL